MDGAGEHALFDEALAETRSAFVAALERGDAATAAGVYAADARLLPPAAELLQGREAIMAFWAAGVEAGIAGVEIETLEVTRDGCHAYEIGRYALRLRPDEGGTVVDRGRYVLVHARQEDGAWRRSVEMFSPDASPARTDSVYSTVTRQEEP